MNKTCVVCGNGFAARGIKKTCGPACSARRSFNIKLLYRDANRERRRQIDRRYRAKNRELAREKARRRRAENLEHVLEIKRRYREANRERIREQDRCYRAKNPELAREKARLRRVANPDLFRKISKERSRGFRRRKLTLTLLSLPGAIRDSISKQQQPNPI
jgi:hypothetical protein